MRLMITFVLVYYFHLIRVINETTDPFKQSVYIIVLAICLLLVFAQDVREIERK